MKIPILLIILLAVCGFTHESFGRTGGKEGGGGTGCQSAGINDFRLTLLDLVLARPEIQEHPAQPEFKSTQAETLLSPDALATLPSFKLALQRLESWQAMQPDSKSIARLKFALTTLAIYTTSRRLGSVARAFIPPRSACSSANLIPLALYNQGAISLNIETWNDLGRLSRSGLLIHESLRQIQLLHAANGADEDLQAITAILMLDRPNSSLLLDKMPFFGEVSDADALAPSEQKVFCQFLRRLKRALPSLSSTYPKSIVACTVGSIDSVIAAQSEITGFFERSVSLNEMQKYAKFNSLATDWILTINSKHLISFQSDSLDIVNNLRQQLDFIENGSRAEDRSK